MRDHGRHIPGVGARHAACVPIVDVPRTADSAERPTLVPTFDVAQLARDSGRWAPPPPPRESDAHVVVPASSSGESSVHLRATEMYWDRIGNPDAIARLTVPPEWIHPDERAECAGFILCRVDGVRTVAQIIDDSTLPLLTALSLVCSLLDAGILVVD
jgi:hypothetical protein